MGKLSMLPLGLYEKAMCFSWSWREKLEFVRESGYNYMEINIDGTPERLERLDDPACALALQAACRETGIPVYTFALTANRAYPLGSEDTKTREQGIALLKKAVVFAQRAGIRVIHIAAYDEVNQESNDNTRGLFTRAVMEGVQYAARHGVVLAFETMDMPFMNSVCKVMEYVRLLDSPYLQVYADVANITAAGYDPAFELSAGGRHIVGIHLKDSRGSVIRDVPFGEGDVDFDACFRALAQIQYGGFFTAEMWCYEAPAFCEYVKEANRFLREKLACY